MRARGQGSRRGPLQGIGSEFFGEFYLVSPSGVSLSDGPADPGRAFQRFPAVPPADRCCAFGASLPFGPGKVAVVRSGGVSGLALEVGALLARGHGSTCGAAWEWAGPAAGARGWGWVRNFSVHSTMLRLAAFYCRAFRQIPSALSSASLLYLMADPCRSSGASLRWVGWGGKLGERGWTWGRDRV